MQRRETCLIESGSALLTKYKELTVGFFFALSVHNKVGNMTDTSATVFIVQSGGVQRCWINKKAG